MGKRTDLNAQRAIDQQIATEIRAHKERVRALKSCRNEYCAINRIPEETLTYILLLVKRLSEDSHVGNHGSARRDWFNITRVCNSWRKLVMDCPRFWTYVDSSSRHAHRMLTLAKAAPLHVVLRTPPRPTKKFWSLATNVMSRTSQIENLDINLPQQQVMSLLALSSTQRALILQDLIIWADNPDDVNGSEAGCLWWDMPSLLSLNVSHVPLPVEPLHAPRLTQLRLFSSFGIAMPWLLDTLRATPLMETISVEDLGPEPIGLEASSVSLTHLQKIYIHADCFSAVNIFKYLKYPVTCTMAMFDKMDGSETTVAGLRETFSRFTSNYLPSPLERIYIMFVGRFGLYVYRPGDHYPRYDLDGADPFISFNAPPSSKPPISAYIELCHALPLSHTRILALEGAMGNLILPAVLSLMIASTHTKTLELIHCDPRLLTHLFQTSSDDPPVLPELECLIFMGDMFHIHLNSASEPLELLPVLLQLLRERKRLGIPIRTLKCWHCKRLPPSDIKKLHQEKPILL
ncbi:hypothetical protein ONZ45_g7559 [Pleurotus djamor]|nr:hypothetical protein ONZ45_g7559 [Pleurotus djamor]